MSENEGKGFLKKMNSGSSFSFFFLFRFSSERAKKEDFLFHFLFIFLCVFSLLPLEPRERRWRGFYLYFF